MAEKCMFSIIVPVYNTGKFLANCLDSLLEQDIPRSEYEIICVNDGSTDNSLSILQEYARNNENVVVVDKHNEGVSVARNVGLDHAKGEYVWIIDSDDWIVRNCFSFLKNSILEHNPSVVQVYLDYIKAQ